MLSKIIFIAVVGLALCDPLEDGLQSGEALVKLFTAYAASEGRVYSANEARMRVRLFKKNLEGVVATNKADLTWRADINMFSDMTEDEKRSYLGLNMSIPHSQGTPMPLTAAPAAGSIDWRQKGAVTGVKNQGSCGSCWTFGAVGSTEGVHKIATGSLVTFAEQEFLDCVYEGKRDGCQGGWMQDCFTYAQRTQRLAPSSAVSYRGRDGSCNYRGKANGLKAKVTGMYDVPASESGHMSGLTRGPIAVAFEVTSACQQYRSGILRDTSCRGNANHAVTMVAYDSSKFAIKNSWGGSWGSSGYVYMARNHHNCKLYMHSAVITLSGNNPGPDPTDGPDPGPTDGPSPDCRDEYSTCALYQDYMCRYYVSICKKTCGAC